MANYRMVLQYEGTRYQGWQRQESTGNTIQGKLEMLLSRLNGYQVEVQGSGRTDAGVHAWGQAANFHLRTEEDPAGLLRKINEYLPEDIAVLRLERVPDRFHSRLNAKGKTYCYRVHQGPVRPVFERKFVHWEEGALDVEAMQKAAGYLLGTHDFKSFTSAKKSRKSTVRTIESIKIVPVGDELRFFFSGNGFLFHMVRILTGTLLEAGRGERSPESIPALLASRNRENAGPLAPAQGLALMEVRY